MVVADAWGNARVTMTDEGQRVDAHPGGRQRFMRGNMRSRLAGAIIGAVVTASPMAGVTQTSRDTAAEISATWTAIIPDRYPRYVYSWHLRTDGRYEEDGHDVGTGRRIQETLSGHWTTDGLRMILKQDDLPFVFDGIVVGDSYAGTLYLEGRSYSKFCATKGESPPRVCDVVERSS
jgi:hypothetical protein